MIAMKKMHQTSVFCVLTVRAQALRSIMENYESLLNLWEVVDDCRDSDIKARTLGVQGTAAMTVKTLSLLRNEDMWTMFWKKLELSDRWKSCKQSYIATATQSTPQIRGLHRWKSNA